MRSSVKQILGLMNRRSRNGQSILIVAFAFIALIAFVGIAVDVALLFVRFSSLTRAVDAAAIAAAGQIREGTDYATLHAVAQQFIKLQGNVDPDTVRVETCETEIFDWIKKKVAEGVSPEPTAEDALQDILNPPSGVGPSELCKKDPQKLVRVSAQLNSPTTFLALLGWGTVLLETSAVSQTAVLDVALVIDTSRSMADDTIDIQIEKYGSSFSVLRSYPEFLEPFDGHLKPYDYQYNYNDPSYDINAYDIPYGFYGKNAAGEPAIRTECARDYEFGGNYGWGGCCNDPTTQTNPPDGTEPQRSFTINFVEKSAIYNVDVNGNPQFTANPPPLGTNYDVDWYIYDAPGLSEAKIMVNGINTYVTPNKNAARVVSGMPDGNYSDLVCRPFKDVRDAARRFIKRLDFVRGDRLILVTYDSDVQEITPTGRSIPVITDKETAIRTLNERVGVSVNPNGMPRRCISDPNVIIDPNTGRPTKWVNWRAVNSYWTVSQCRDTNTGGGIRQGRASLTNPDWIRRDSVWVMVVLSDGPANRTPSYAEISAEFPVAGPEQDWLSVPSVDRPHPETGELPPYGSGLSIEEYCGDPTDPANFFDYNPSNPNYNILGMKPHLCVPPTWTGGAAWGLGGTDSGGNPVARYSFGFCPWYTFCNNVDSGSPFNPVLPECPAVTDSRPIWRPEGAFSEPAHPYCIDWNPDTRHFCKDQYGVINSQDAYCDPRYDPDDYARDQADYAGLIDFTSRTKGSFIAMYAIFFMPRDDIALEERMLGIKLMRYVADAGDNGLIDNRLQLWFRTKHEEHVMQGGGVAKAAPNPDPLELLRNHAGGDLRNIPQTTDPFYNIPGVIDVTEPHTDPCYPFDYLEQLIPAQRTPENYEAMFKQDCGQFWFASSITKVNDAFTEIAGRLFTRLSR